MCIYICMCVYYVYVFPATRNVTGGTIKTLTMLSRNGLSEALEIPGFIIALPIEIPPFWLMKSHLVALNPHWIPLNPIKILVINPKKDLVKKSRLAPLGLGEDHFDGWGQTGRRVPGAKFGDSACLSQKGQDLLNKSWSFAQHFFWTQEFLNLHSGISCLWVKCLTSNRWLSENDQLCGSIGTPWPIPEGHAGVHPFRLFTIQAACPLGTKVGPRGPPVVDV